MGRWKRNAGGNEGKKDSQDEVREKRTNEEERGRRGNNHSGQREKEREKERENNMDGVREMFGGADCVREKNKNKKNQIKSKKERKLGIKSTFFFPSQVIIWRIISSVDNPEKKVVTRVPDSVFRRVTKCTCKI